MALRQAKIVTSRREGRNVFYRLTNPDILTLVREAGTLIGISINEIQTSDAYQQVSGCICPHCSEIESVLIPTTAIAIPTG
jgi:hypothetical protein